MAKFPDPTKQYQGEPIDKPIDANELKMEKFQSPKPTPPTPPKPPTGTPVPPTSSPPPGKTFTKPPTSSPFKNIIPMILGLLVFGAIIFAVIKFVIPLFGDKEPDHITLNYWGLWEPQSVMQQVIADYQRDNPHVTINYTMQSSKSYRTRLQSAIQQGQGPDIARIHNTWLPMLKTSLAPAPADLISPQELADFYPVIQRDFSSGGSMYALPLMIDGLALYYNQDLLTQVGEEPPTDWNELRKVAFRLTARNAETGIIERAGVAVGTTENIDHWSDILGLLMLQNSADPSKPNSQEVQDTLSFYTIFTTQDKIWDETQPNSIYAFATGSVAMILAPSWQAQQIEAINPDLNFAVVPAPTLPGADIAWATYWAEAVPASSQNQEEAWKFIKFLSSRESLQKLYTAESQIRGYGEPYPRKSMANLIEGNPIMGAFVSQGPNYESWYLSDRTQDEGINDQISKYYQDAINSINDGRSISSILKTLASGVDQVLAKFPDAN